MGKNKDGANRTKGNAKVSKESTLFSIICRLIMKYYLITSNEQSFHIFNPLIQFSHQVVPDQPIYLMLMLE